MEFKDGFLCIKDSKMSLNCMHLSYALENSGHDICGNLILHLCVESGDIMVLVCRVGLINEFILSLFTHGVGTRFCATVWYLLLLLRHLQNGIFKRLAVV